MGKLAGRPDLAGEPRRLAVITCPEHAFKIRAATSYTNILISPWLAATEHLGEQIGYGKILLLLMLSVHGGGGNEVSPPECIHRNLQPAERASLERGKSPVSLHPALFPQLVLLRRFLNWWICTKRLLGLTFWTDKIYPVVGPLRSTIKIKTHCPRLPTVLTQWVLHHNLF